MPTKNLLRRCLCRHSQAVERSRTSRLIDAGMRKEITLIMYCPDCGREFRRIEYV